MLHVASHFISTSPRSHTAPRDIPRDIPRGASRGVTVRGASVLLQLDGILMTKRAPLRRIVEQLSHYSNVL